MGGSSRREVALNLNFSTPEIETEIDPSFGSHEASTSPSSSPSPLPTFSPSFTTPGSIQIYDTPGSAFASFSLSSTYQAPPDISPPSHSPSSSPTAIPFSLSPSNLLAVSTVHGNTPLLYSSFEFDPFLEANTSSRSHGSNDLFLKGYSPSIGQTPDSQTLSQTPDSQTIVNVPLAPGSWRRAADAASSRFSSPNLSCPSTSSSNGDARSLDDTFSFTSSAFKYDGHSPAPSTPNTKNISLVLKKDAQTSPIVLPPPSVTLSPQETPKRIIISSRTVAAAIEVQTTPSLALNGLRSDAESAREVSLMKAFDLALIQDDDDLRGTPVKMRDQSVGMEETEVQGLVDVDSKEGEGDIEAEIRRRARILKIRVSPYLKHKSFKII